MLIANDEENNKIIAHSSLKGKFATCPFCEKKVLCKSGSIRIPHFAHLAGECEHAKEGETEWHLNWKKRLMQEGHKIEQKVYDIEYNLDNGENYFKRADVITKNGVVIEFQNSPISLIEVDDRTSMYSKKENGTNGIIWVFNYINKAHKISNYKKFQINWIEKHINFLKYIDCLIYLDLGLDEGIIEYNPFNYKKEGYIITHKHFIKQLEFIRKSDVCIDKIYDFQHKYQIFF